MNLIQKLICKLYYRYCYKQSTLAWHILTYYVPFILKEGPVTGTYLFGIINDTITKKGDDLWVPPAGTERGKIIPLVDITLANGNVNENISNKSTKNN